MNSNRIFHGSLTDLDVRPRVVAYYFKQWDGFEMAHHSHTAVEIMYVISGSCVVETREQSFAMEKGHFIVIDADIEHRLIVAPGTSCRMLNVEFEFGAGEQGCSPSMKELAAADDALSGLLGSRRGYLLLNDPSEVYQTLKSLVLELDGGRGGSRLLADLLLSQLLLRIARLSREADRALPNTTDAYVRKAVDYIHHHYDCDIQIKEIAEAVNLHPGYLHRVFRGGMGCTPMDYLTRFRMEKARMLLEQTDIPVIEISGYVGVNSRQYFSTLFKKHTGCTPQSYRKAVRKDFRE
ncbi:AraC family transcriptional regulator [Paenibacillus sp. NEAU-GSW1]|uniref:AraC family transcriptional regulator n=1 Tax=Paenibacillus sp. NEAU-GSW1 TaxID=2682486 RepID=UPI0012E20394|nr:AraC family transcriptional regulator [Paenibacillus sp. NEAU-GSW1]MUT67152.1 helix-turn-helix domain-containing protein [Paenibacillus sp. NEAU-GSW1]